jgi:hypothetical protein
MADILFNDSILLPLILSIYDIGILGNSVLIPVLIYIYKIGWDNYILLLKMMKENI